MRETSAKSRYFLGVLSVGALLTVSGCFCGGSSEGECVGTIGATEFNVTLDGDSRYFKNYPVAGSGGSRTDDFEIRAGMGSLAIDLRVSPTTALSAKENLALPRESFACPNDAGGCGFPPSSAEVKAFALTIPPVDARPKRTDGTLSVFREFDSRMHLLLVMNFEDASKLSCDLYLEHDTDADLNVPPRSSSGGGSDGD